ncbi:DUF2254 domain-containing protein [Alteromonas sp. A079]|uniref:DUF2254 domain-containing protein n=1 Tax=Alteromonas sp. A079 TaxID=3410268 RepID=UPI003BA0B408
MDAPISVDKLRFLLFRFKEKLWVRPLTLCILSICAVFFAKLADLSFLAQHLPSVEQGSVDSLLSIMASSMLVIATFSAGTMVNAYASASQSSTPRSLSLIISDDVSQNALSTFVGAFIYSVVALTVSENHFFSEAGIFVLFVMTGIVFGVVIITFVRWVDSVARLGRVGSTILKVEAATKRAIEHRIDTPYLGGVGSHMIKEQGAYPIFTDKVGYIQLVDMSLLQNWAKRNNAFVNVVKLPGQFVTPNEPIAFVSKDVGNDVERLLCTFKIHEARSFEADPRFGFIVMAEIASKALSTSINDPGTAIAVITSFTRLLRQWEKREETRVANDKSGVAKPKYDCVSVPALDTESMYDDAFTSVMRDGAAVLEVNIKLLKSLAILHNTDNETQQQITHKFAQKVFTRANASLKFDDDKTRIKDLYEALFEQPK